MKKYLLVYNPQAGNGRAAQLLAPISDYLEAKVGTLEVALTGYPGHATEIVKAANLADFNGVIASGGDGTLFEVLNGLVKNPQAEKIPLGLIPNGTGNAFMKELDLTEGDWRQAVDIIAAGKAKKLDIGELVAVSHAETETKAEEAQPEKAKSDAKSEAAKSENIHHYFINMVGMGFVSTVAKAANRLKWMGNAAYTVATLVKLIKLKPQKIWFEVDGQQFERDGVFVEVANSRYTGTRFLMAPKAQLDDGLLDLVVLNKISKLKLLRLFTSIYSGSHINYPEVEYFQAKKIRIREQHPDVIIPDGEMMAAAETHYQVLPQCIEFFWPVGQ